MSVFVHLYSLFTNGERYGNMNKLRLLMDHQMDITIAPDAITAFCEATGLKGKSAKGYFIIDQFERKLKLRVT